MVSQRVLCRRYIGRAAELDHLAGRRRAAGDSHGGAVVVFGDAGIGKTRLIQEYRERYGTRATFAIAVCREFGDRPFEPLAAILGQLESGGARELESAADSRDEQLRSVLAAFERSANRRTTTIVIEDAHWAQVELLQMLGTLSEWAANRRLLLIVTCRENDVAASSPAFKALARLTRSASVLRLEPLADAELGELMDDALAEMKSRLSAETLGDVRRRCAGNPLFAEELLRHAVDGSRDGARKVLQPGLPISLQGVIRERLDRCAPYDRSLLAAASVFGKRFRIDVLGDVFEFHRDDIVAALARLIELQLVDRCDDPLAYEFRHGLTRDVVYGDLVPAEAGALHARIAEALEALPDAGANAELLAHSFWEARLLERAAPYCEAAGDGAFRQYAYEDAAHWFERASVAFEGDPGAAGRALKKAALAVSRLGETKRAGRLYERALETFAAAGDWTQAVHALTALAADLLNNGRGNDAVAASDRAAALAVRSQLPALRTHAALRRFALLVNKFDLDGAAATLTTIDESELDPASRDTFEYFLSKAHYAATRGEREVRRAAIARALECLERRDAPPFEQRYAHGYIAVDSLALGEMAEARRHAQAGLELAQRIRSDEGYMRLVLALVEERAGELAAAREHLAATGPAAPLLNRHVRALVAVRLALAAGDDDALHRVLEFGLLEEAERGGIVSMTIQQRAAFAAVLEGLGRSAEARAFAERAVADLSAEGGPFGLAWQIATLARLLPERIGELRALVVQGGAPPSGALDDALVALLDARAAHAAGDELACKTCARRAAAGFGAVGWPSTEAECLELAGDAGAALAIYRRHGYVAHVRRLERDVPPQPAGSRGTGALSPRERELARLVALGKNNREAALELSVTVKAVEKYLTSIYQKLGVKSRSQLTALIGSAGDA